MLRQFNTCIHLVLSVKTRPSNRLSYARAKMSSSRVCLFNFDTDHPRKGMQPTSWIATAEHRVGNANHGDRRPAVFHARELEGDLKNSAGVLKSFKQAAQPLASVFALGLGTCSSATSHHLMHHLKLSCTTIIGDQRCSNTGGGQKLRNK